ncbi:MAG: response regulator, partial [Candidatus Acidiferrales bacterium]
MSATPDVATGHVPTIYFIDDSATMREVIRVAFRRENFKVVACADAASALAQFDLDPPDAVITDVIMPDKNGYEVCQFVKQHPQFNLKPVILMSGIVNRTVAEKAKEVKADELIRKPFQPQELIARVKSLLHIEEPVSAPAFAPAAPSTATGPLTGIFAPAPVAPPP